MWLVVLCCVAFSARPPPPAGTVTCYRYYCCCCSCYCSNYYSEIMYWSHEDLSLVSLASRISHDKPTQCRHVIRSDSTYTGRKSILDFSDARECTAFSGSNSSDAAALLAEVFNMSLRQLVAVTQGARKNITNIKSYELKKGLIHIWRSLAKPEISAQFSDVF